VCVPDPEGIEEGPFKALFRIGTFVEGCASEPRGPCAIGGIGREGSAIEVLDLGMTWVAEFAAGSCGGGFIGSEGL
jgi:hypothetical protein